MLLNILWLAIINIKRNKQNTILYFLMCMVLTIGILSMFLSRTIINLPEFRPLKEFFNSTIFLTLSVSISILIGLAYFQIINRKTEIAIYRIFGVRKSDLFFMLSIETIIISTTATLIGIIITLVTLFGIQNILLEMIKSLYSTYLRILMFSAVRTFFTILIINILITLAVFTLNSGKEMEKLLRGTF